MPDLTPWVALTVFVLAFCAGAGWTLGCWLMSLLLGALRRGG